MKRKIARWEREGWGGKENKGNRKASKNILRFKRLSNLNFFSFKALNFVLPFRNL